MAAGGYLKKLVTEENDKNKKNKKGGKNLLATGKGRPSRIPVPISKDVKVSKSVNCWNLKYSNLWSRDDHNRSQVLGSQSESTIYQNVIQPANAINGQDSNPGNCCDTSQNDTIGKIELNPSFILSSDNTNCKNDIQ